MRKESDQYEVRSAIAKTFLLLSELVEEVQLMDMVKCIVEEGLNDRNEECRNLMRNAGITTIRRVSFIRVAVDEEFDLYQAKCHPV